MKLSQFFGCKIFTVKQLVKYLIKFFFNILYDKKNILKKLHEYT